MHTLPNKECLLCRLPQTKSQNDRKRLRHQQLLLTSSSGGVIASIDKTATSTVEDLGSNSKEHSSTTKNKKYRKNRGEMKLLGKYLDELRRNKSFDSLPNSLQTESEFEAVFAEGGVKIGKYIKRQCVTNF